MSTRTQIHANMRLCADGARTPAAENMPDLESVLAAYPGMKASRSVIVDHLYGEYYRRCREGETIDAVAFCEQFPAFRDSLLAIIRAHGACDQLARDREAEQWPDWLQPGTGFLGFSLGRELGRGTFARVHLASELAVGHRTVVLKITRYPGREAESLGALSHPGVTPVYSVHVDLESGLTAVCMPYLGRATLAHVLARVFARGDRRRDAQVVLAAVRDFQETPLAPTESASRILCRGTYLEGVVELAAHIADALAYVHEAGICHRDMKPSNVLLTRTGRPVLVDFNLSATRPADLTHAAGTAPYMAPEQLEAFDEHGGAFPNSVAGPAADVFSLGVMVYELLTGRHPFGPISLDLTVPELVRQLRIRQRNSRPSLTRREDGIEPWLARLLVRCLSHNPNDRPTARELSQAFAAGLAWRHRWVRRLNRRRIFIAATMLGLAVTGAGIGLSRPALEPSQNALAVAQADMHNGRYEEAIGQLSRLLDRDPRQATGFFLRARAKQALGRLEDAVQDYESACRLSPAGAIRASLGYCFNLQGQPRAATAAYRTAIAAQYRTPAVYNNLGCTLVRIGQFQQGVEYLDKALALDSRLQSSLYVRATVCLTSSGRRFVSPRQAIADIEKAIVLGTPTGRLYYDAARLHAMLASAGPQHRQIAIRYLKLAVTLGLDPGRLRHDHHLMGLCQDPELHSLLRSPTASRSPLSQPNTLLDPAPPD